MPFSSLAIKVAWRRLFVALTSHKSIKALIVTELWSHPGAMLEPPEEASQSGSASFANQTQILSGYFVFISLLQTLLVSRGCVWRLASKPQFTAISAPPQHQWLIVALRERTAHQAARIIRISGGKLGETPVPPHTHTQTNTLLVP